MVGSTLSVYCACPYLFSSSANTSPFFTYRSILVLGVLLATSVVLLRAPRWGFSRQQVFDGVLSAAMGGAIVGRGAYVVANWVYFRIHLLEAIQIWRGGLSASGVIAGAVVGVLILCHLRRIPSRPLLNVLAPGAAMVAVFGWMACCARGCSWGIELWPDQGLLWELHMDLPDLYGLHAPRFPVQIVGVAWNAILTGILLLWRRRGRLFSTWLFLYALGDFGLAFLRGDVSPRFAGLAPIQWADLGLVLVALFSIIRWDTDSVRRRIP